jgi:hypothetical protein
MGGSISGCPDLGGTDRMVPTAVDTTRHIGFKYFFFVLLSKIHKKYLKILKNIW